ncbi:MAG: aminotransferase class V-fold PLP-dependent enzyme [Anaerolineaceae bacterium]|jgi:selenocysteine lyase/cysteine desulfurase|nr:aminotransferase class V-fold PLP-dependent enzyme [Anaerolineaceae bacterium]
MTENYPDGKLFSVDLQQEIKSKFYYVDEDPDIGPRLFFENAGGALRLKSVLEKYSEVDAIPDCPERIHKMAIRLQDIMEKSKEDIRIILNAKEGSIIPGLTASQVMFEIVRSVAENITSGTNMVTTVMEHPSAFDCMEYFAKKTNRELRVALSDKVTGGVSVDSIIELIDENTTLLSCMYASNITGAIFNLEEIVRRAREIKPDLYIVCDAVQHAPHGVIDLQKMPVDGITFAPYKMFGNRGSGIGFVSPRLADLPHNKLSAKPADEWELGSPAPSQFAVISEIVDYVCWLGSNFNGSTDRRTLFVEGMTQIKLQERALMSAMLNGVNGKPGLRSMNNVKVFVDNKVLSERDFISVIGFDNITPSQAVREYEKRNVIVYDRLATSLYSKRMLDSFGIEGAVRVSPLHCHSASDIEKFLDITSELAKL